MLNLDFILKCQSTQTDIFCGNLAAAPVAKSWHLPCFARAGQHDRLI